MHLGPCRQKYSSTDNPAHRARLLTRLQNHGRPRTKSLYTQETYGNATPHDRNRKPTTVILYIYLQCCTPKNPNALVTCRQLSNQHTQIRRKPNYRFTCIASVTSCVEECLRRMVTTSKDSASALTSPPDECQMPVADRYFQGRVNRVALRVAFPTTLV